MGDKQLVTPKPRQSWLKAPWEHTDGVGVKGEGEGGVQDEGRLAGGWGGNMD